MSPDGHAKEASDADAEPESAFWPPGLSIRQRPGACLGGASAYDGATFKARSLHGRYALANRRPPRRRPARRPGCRACLLRPRRKLPRRSRRALRRADRRHRLPPGGRRRDDGRGRREAHRPARHRHGDARPGRHQRLARDPHRGAGFDADDPLHRPGRARHARAARPSRRSTIQAFFGSIAKWVVEIDDAARIPELLARAFRVAMQGRPGPVVISLPEDMLTDEAAVADAPRVEPAETWPGNADMMRLQSLLWAARRPFVIAGGSGWSGARGCRAGALLRAIRPAGRRPPSAARCCFRPIIRTMRAMSASAPIRRSRSASSPPTC